MNDDPYSRPSQEEEERHKPTVTWWASLDHDNARRVSPLCASFDAATRWALEEAHEVEEVTIWERTKRSPGSPAEDKRVWPDEDDTIVRERLGGVVRNLAARLADANRRRNVASTPRKGSGHVARPMKTMDPLTRMLTYDEVYDEHGEPRFAFGDDGWPEREAKR